LTDVRIVYPDHERHNVAPGEPLRFDVEFESVEAVHDMVVGIAIYGPLGQVVYGTNTDLKGIHIGTVDGPCTVRFRFGAVPLLDGAYGLTDGLTTMGGLVYD